MTGLPTVTAARPLAHVPALDGLRGVAVMLVMGLHVGLAVVPGGQVGVLIFFSLSGFLITQLLLDDLRGQRQRVLRRFYARRALRLVPAWLSVVVACGVLAWLWPEMERAEATIDGLPMVLLHLGNWSRAFEGAGSLGVLDHTWSLAVEEQFYLVWPFVLLLVLRLTRRMWVVAAVAGTGCCAALAARMAVDGVGAGALDRVYNGTDTQADHLMLGCALAVVVTLARERGGVPQLRAVLTRLAAPAAIFLAALTVVFPFEGASVGYRLTLSAVAVASAVLVGAAYLSGAGCIAQVLGAAWLRWAGVRSYGLYLWHYPVIAVVTSTGLVPFTLPKQVIEVALSLAVAAASYRWVEQPFLRRKKGCRAVDPGLNRAGPPMCGTPLPAGHRQQRSP
ncbi:peptidoglycan/LPS O-acetylase OafA/YrhL [Blastococcus saxobsidens]|uniref:Peptidoglycan/LPS O-acetylase OafA/YrhL n=1 Tax=Blastococcus saxobsidens TaxID=138336 RepID=A0A4Q7YCV6_9ACTN|nr:peptidoglycan/LPS O-acetylase OafA/YrhL [Blastococcus saxobsidens]